MFLPVALCRPAIATRRQDLLPNNQPGRLGGLSGLRTLWRRQSRLTAALHLHVLFFSMLQLVLSMTFAAVLSPSMALSSPLASGKET